MPVYVVAHGRTVNRAMHDDYVAKALPSLPPHRGKIVAFSETPDVIEGSVANPRVVLLEFPSREAFRAWYDSPEYQAILPLRLESAPGTLLVVEA